MARRSVLLNGKPLSFFEETELPEFEPIVSNNEKGLSIELPSGGIGFWVVPDQKVIHKKDKYLDDRRTK